MARRQGIYWLLTIPHSDFTPYLPEGINWIRGQLERGSDTEYLHWQILVATSSKTGLPGIKRIFGHGIHAELTRSASANDYVWKEETRVEGTQFELGTRPFKRNNASDWDAVWRCAMDGDILSIPAEIRVRHYRTLRAIAADYSQPVAMERTCDLFVGPTGTGKSKLAWERAGLEAYCKDPNSKFWCGYSGQEHVVIDEFRGRIDVSHLLRWLDRYPVNVEVKGSSVPLRARSFWITSNLDIEQWYPELDEATVRALKRRIKVTRFENFFNKAE